MKQRPFVVAAILICLLTTSLGAQQSSLGPLPGPSIDTRRAELPTRLGETLAPSAARTLEDAFDSARDAIVAMESRNAAGLLPAQNGVARQLPLALEVRHGGTLERGASLELGQALRDDGDLVRWATRFDVEGSHRLRVHLEEVSLPAGTQLWVHGSGDESVGPLAVEELLFEGELWTPSVAGPTFFLELALPAAADSSWGFVVREVVELFELDDEGRVVRFRVDPDTSCLQDAACFGNSALQNYDSLSASVAHLQFVDGGGSFICSGNLLNNTAEDFTPYFLTANHCFSRQGAASSLEAFWDYRASSCNGNWPSLGSLPRSNGATLLSSKAGSDYTLLRLSGVPGGRVFLGWTTAAPADESSLYRISHPLGLPQAFSTASAESNPGSSFTQGCGSNANFLYSDPLDGVGATFGGSSGSSVVTGNLQVVGQLSGGCGSNIDEPCQGRLTDYDFDGRFSVTFSNIQQWLAPSGGGGSGTQPCSQDLSNGVICLRNGRFELSMETTNFSNQTEPVIFKKNTEEVALGVFSNNTNDVTVVAKVTNGCPINGNFWVWLGAFTAAELDLTVRDTQTGQTKSYGKGLGGLMTTVKDDSTFPCN